MNIIHADFIVIGSGLAGSTAAFLLSELGEVVLISKEPPTKSNSHAAQGGIAAAIGDTDSPMLHAEDTEVAGNGMCSPEVVKTTAQSAPTLIRWLMDMGVHFDRDQRGQLDLGMEGAHSRHRILHAGGDTTGKQIMNALTAQLTTATEVRRATHERAISLLQAANGRVVGVVTLSDLPPHTETIYYGHKGVILATGGVGQLYARTTNPLGAIGDGIALAYSAGTKIRNLEFIQFHPTALDMDHTFRFLISEAVRGAGGRLINSANETIMAEHPLRDLAPRDVVARTIYAHSQSGEKIFLDCRDIREFKKHFPTIHKRCLSHHIDPSTQPIPVAPAAHFLMGGIVTSTAGETNIPGLYAIGETASTGLHGANRLASNSLLECIAMAFALTKHLRENPERIGVTPITTTNLTRTQKLAPDQPVLLQTIQHIMWEYAGIVRHHNGLVTGMKKLDKLHQTHPQSFALLVAKLIMQSALTRQESRGAQYRSDFPLSEPTLASMDTIICKGAQTALVLSHA